MKNKLILILISLFFIAFKSNAEIIKKIDIIGNKIISDESIISIINFKNNKNYSNEDINNFQKTLFKTDFFQSIKINLENNFLKITVKENPIVNFLYIDGVKNKQRRKDIESNLSLQQNKIFSENLLKKDINLIKENFKNSGYYNVTVEPNISKISNGSLNIILKINRNDLLKINKVSFIGNNSFSHSTLSDVISSSVSGWWKFLTTSSNVIENRLEFDVSLLKKFYLNNGYYDVQINSADIEIINSGQANIVFSLQEGTKYLFSEYKIVDNNNFFDEQNTINLKKIIDNKLKDHFSLSKLDFIRDEISFYFTQKKFEFINLIIEPNKNKNKIDVNFIFESAPRTYVNSVNIRGNSITEEQVIRREITYASGDPLSLLKIQKSEDNLKNLGIFESIKTEYNKITAELVDVNIRVEEKPTGTIAAGLGVGTAGSNINTSLQEKNLFGKGININSDISIGTEKISGYVNTTIPDFNNNNNALITSLFARSTDFENAGYENSLFGGSLSIKYDFYEDIFVQPGFGIEHDTIDTSDTASELYKKREGNYLSLRSFYDIYSDKRNRRFNPTNGYKFGFGQSLVLPGSDIMSLENFVYGTYYKPLTKDYIFNFKSGINSINSFSNDDVKLSDRLFLNDSKLRGFESFGIGPKDGKDHIGGNYSFYSSISSTFPNFLPKKWNANSVLFLDTANVWGVDYNDSLDSNKIRSSAGVSLNWISPIGPLSFTLSEPLTYDDGDKKEQFNFKIGSTF